MNVQEHVEVLETNLAQLMEEMDADPNAIERIFEGTRKNREQRTQRGF